MVTAIVAKWEGYVAMALKTDYISHWIVARFLPKYLYVLIIYGALQITQIDQITYFFTTVIMIKWSQCLPNGITFFGILNIVDAIFMENVIHL